jgi:2-polyprenyl-3-methyl-5-hydroxy-6-metoxy-1,4-benzoquinol methylase
MTQSAAMATPAGEQPAHSCWACGAADFQPYKARSIDRALVPDDLRISDANYGCTLGLRRCIRCGFIFAEPADLNGLFALYEALDDPGYEASQESRALQMDWLLDVAQQQRAGIRTALDVGAATGLLVSLARKRGWDAQGVEPSVKLVEVAAHVHGVQLIQGSIPHSALAGRRFDCVFLVDVIEHVADPRSLLKDCADLLAPDGILVVVTPDVGSLARRILGKRWWHFRLAHVGYFDRGSFAKLCARAGLLVSAQVRAKWFFRVSYLAERLTRYLPVDPILRLLERSQPGRRVANLVVPLNLFDSWVFICRKTHGDH